MPKYDYKCDTCGHTQEVSHSLWEDYNGDICYSVDEFLEVYDDTVCPGVMKRVFQATPAVFKGQGWANKGPTYKSPKGSYE